MNEALAARRAQDAIAHLCDPEPPWTELLCSMHELVGGESATLIVLEGSGELITFQQHNIPEAVKADYSQNFCSHDLLIPPTRGAPSGSWFDTQELYSPSFLSKDPFYVDFMCRYQARRMMAHILEESPQRRIALTIQRCGGGEPVRPMLESARVRKVTQALRWGMNQRMSLATQWLNGAEAAFDALQEAVCLCTPRGAVIRSSALALEHLAANAGLHLRNGHLKHSTPSVHAALLSGLARAVAVQGSLQFTLPNKTGAGDRLELVRAPSQLSHAVEPLIFIRVRLSQARAGVSIDALSHAFGITPTEARVLAGLMAGLSAKQYALKHDVSVHTVRSQISALMGKMDCARQVDLVRQGLRATAQ